ncbi:MAG TPA: MFS transporter [Pyrinomonadaceae bacterium]|nr:MFS transporter [Pyrinomonadaceae bacterium]
MTYRQLLKGNADFRRLWTGQVISEIGDWLNNIAVLALTIQLAGRGREGLAIAIYAIARHLPLFVFGPVAGVVVDRVNRRRVMIAADLARALLALGFIAASARLALPLIYLVGASLFAVSAFFNAAKRASIPNIVRSAEELLGANSLSASTTAATIAVGSALGGVIATFVGRNTVFILNAATFLLSAEMIRRIRSRTRRSHAQHDLEQDGQPLRIARARPQDADAVTTEGRARPSFRAIARRALVDFREGLRYVRSNQVLRAVFIVAGGWGLGNGAARALYSIFGARLGTAAVASLVARPTDFGISVLFVAMGLGGVIGAPIARRFNSVSGEGLGSRMGRSMIFDGCGLALFSLMPTLLGAALVLVAREVNFAIWWTAQQTIIMTRTDDRYGGRVFASYETLTTLMMVGSMLAAGAAADTYGIRPVAAIGGMLIALSGVLWFWMRGRRARRARNERAAFEVENF